jgi:hypothetical protein
MKKIAICMIVGMVSMPVIADKYVNGYTRSDGTYVDSYYRTSPNNTVYDNYSTKGNQNPYTGSYGTKSYDSYSAPSYSTPSSNNYGWDNIPPGPQGY